MKVLLYPQLTSSVASFFSNYERNLRIFSNFALNTDTDENPWVVVNTGDRLVCLSSFIDIMLCLDIIKSYSLYFTNLFLEGMLPESH